MHAVNAPDYKQAVLLIHGCGERRPMSTVRPFVEAVLGTPPVAGEAYWSKPDALATSMELRRLRARVSPHTDFFEYYWAHLGGGGSTFGVFSWFFGVLLRHPADVPVGLRSLWGASWVLVTAFAVLVLWAALAGWSANVTGVWALLGSLAVALAQWKLVRNLGDAAQYLSPNPENIKLRQTVREEGVRVLEALHTRGYDRVILVGHSLGSVIGYDLLNFYWQRIHDRPENPKAGPQPALDELVERAAALDRAEPASEFSFRKAQSSLLIENAAMGFRWRVSDFITLGSPLAHAALLMADGPAELNRRVRQREFPTCPPVGDPGADKNNAIAYRPADPGLPRTLHFAAPFAVTRWTNFYFPASLSHPFDLVGGPLRGVFGRGIADIALRHGGGGDSAFWTQARVGPGDPLTELVNSLDLGAQPPT